jgi:hypothetical protein
MRFSLAARLGALSAVLAAFVVTTACMPAASGSFTADAFEQTPYHYKVLAPDTTLGQGWLIDNFYTSPRNGRLEPKTADIYRTKYELDINGDGRVDVTHEEPTYDLRYTHRQRASVIWLRTFPLPQNLEQTELRVLMRQYVDEIAGAGYEAVRLSPERSVVTERRYAAEIVDQSEARLAGMPAYVATIDVANVDQIKLTPSTRHTRVQVVIGHTPFGYTVSPSGLNKVTYPVLMMAGYSNLPEDFDKDVDTFRKFLGQIDVAGQHGFSAAAPPAATAPPAPPASTTPPADGGGPTG